MRRRISNGRLKRFSLAVEVLGLGERRGLWWNDIIELLGAVNVSDVNSVKLCPVVLLDEI